MDPSLYIFLVLASAAVTITLLVFFILTLDSDLTLYFAEHFGRPINNLKGKVVWITGASSGIGEALAHLLSENGCKLVISASNKDRLDNVRSEIIAKGHSENDILALAFDMKDFEIHGEMFGRVINSFGQLDVLVNNAGRSQRAAFCDIKSSVDEEIFKINTLGPVSLTRLALKHWEETGSAGSIAVVTSVAGKVGAPFSASYTGSKHALHGYFECLRIEALDKPVSISMCCPGPVASRVLENAYAGDGSRVGRKHPKEMKRMSSARCAKLIGVSIANSLDETWISTQPTLAILYLNQYMPSICRSLVSVFTTSKTLHKLRDG